MAAMAAGALGSSGAIASPKTLIIAEMAIASPKTLKMKIKLLTQALFDEGNKLRHLLVEGVNFCLH